MPLYEYRCPDCERVDTLFRPIDQRNDPVYCRDCTTGPLMERVYGPQTHQPGRHKRNPPFPIPKWM